MLDISLRSLCLEKKFDKAEDPEALKLEAASRGHAVCISALAGEGMKEFHEAVGNKLKEFRDRWTLVKAHVPLALSKQPIPLSQQPIMKKEILSICWC